MNKTKYVILLVVVCVLSLAIGFSLAGKLQKNEATDSVAANASSQADSDGTEQVDQTAETTTATTETSTTINSTVEQASASQPTVTNPTLPATITAQEAKTIALQKAGVDSADVWDKEVELENENGKWVYEVSFEKNGTDYEYIIDAQNGDVLYSDVDID